MSTARSWTELRGGWTKLREAAEDLRALLAMRRSGLDARARRRIGVAGAVVVALTVVAAVAPAYLGGPFPRERGGGVLAVFPSMCLGFLALASFSAIASAGGREVVPRDQAVAFPVSTTTDHLGALLLAPLNIAWLVQAWTLIGSVAYALGPTRLWAQELPVLLWVVLATATAQVVGWLAEGARRGEHGVVVVRLTTAVLAAVAGLLLATGRLTGLLDHSPTRLVLEAVLAASRGAWTPWGLGVAALTVLAVVVAVTGALPARWALHRPMREELRLESGRHGVRPDAATDLAMVLRIDRSAVWRSVPLRRGLTVLAVMPGAVALAGALDWTMLTILPGLVASGAALLFGVNTWCLDGTGALWRDSLPVSPRVSFASRVLVLYEVLLTSAAVTLALAALRAGRPTLPELVALLCSTLVVSTQVVSAGMRWSIARPYAVDLRSARATPAPPVVMAGYSARLALVTTVTGLTYSALAEVDDARITLVVTGVLLAWSLWRIERSAQRWCDPVTRSRVVATVSG